MMPLKHWQGAVSLVLAAWLLVSPWVVGFSGDPLATDNALVVGLALGGIAIGALLGPQAWEVWGEAALALWLIVSPWVLGYSPVEGATMTAVITGAAILVLALWALATDPDYNAWLSEHRAH